MSIENHFNFNLLVKLIFTLWNRIAFFAIAIIYISDFNVTLDKSPLSVLCGNVMLLDPSSSLVSQQQLTCTYSIRTRLKAISFSTHLLQRTSCVLWLNLQVHICFLLFSVCALAWGHFCTANIISHVWRDNQGETCLSIYQIQELQSRIQSDLENLIKQSITNGTAKKNDCFSTGFFKATPPACHWSKNM